MSLALIQESAKEARRLAIAGSSLAVGDFRMKKLVGPLEQAGAKVPVFAQVAKAISDLVEGTEAESATRLLGLSTLLNAILYTQGQTGATANFSELEVFAANCTSTRMPARVLKPLVAALTNAGAGRFETIKSACERGEFNDLRLIDPAIQALGDNYAEVADLMAEKVLPGYGPGIVPRLKAGLDLKGKKHDARKLKVMHQLEPESTLELCREALESGSPDVKAIAISCLGRHADCLPLVLEQANAKNKTVRAAALEALAEHDRPEVTVLFGELIKGKALDILARPFRAVRNRQVLNSLLEEGKRVFDLLLKGDAEQISRFGEILDCLAERKDAEVEDFLLACFAVSDELAKLKAPKNAVISGADVLQRFVPLLYAVGSPKTLEAILARRDSIPAAVFGLAFRAALRTWPPAKVHDEFSPLLTQTKGTGKEKNEAVQRLISLLAWEESNWESAAVYPDVDFVEGSLKNVVWDPRWLDAALKADLPVLVCSLARRDHPGAQKYMLNLLKSKPKGKGALLARVMDLDSLIIQALARCQYPELTAVFLDTVAARTKGKQYIDYELQMLLNSARYLPVADLPKLDAFASKLDEKLVDKFLEALEPLRPLNPPTQA